MMRVLFSGVGGALAAAILVAWSERRLKPARLDGDGWRTLRAGWLLNGTILGCAATTAATLAFLVSGGSSRPDAAEQNAAAIGLTLAFGAMTLWTAWMAHGRTIAWRGDALRVCAITGGETMWRLSQVSSVRKREASGEYHVLFRDGSRLRFSVHLSGAQQLVALLRRDR